MSYLFIIIREFMHSTKEASSLLIATHLQLLHIDVDIWCLVYKVFLSLGQSLHAVLTVD